MRKAFRRAPQRAHKFGDNVKRGKKTTARSILIKRLPILKKIKETVDKEVFDSLVLSIISMLNHAIEEGFTSRKHLYSDAGNNGRSDTYVSANNYTPGPSGLFKKV